MDSQTDNFIENIYTSYGPIVGRVCENTRNKILNNNSGDSITSSASGDKIMCSPVKLGPKKNLSLSSKTQSVFVQNQIENSVPQVPQVPQVQVPQVPVPQAPQVQVPQVSFKKSIKENIDVSKIKKGGTNMNKSIRTETSFQAESNQVESINQINQTNQTKQINQTNQINQTLKEIPEKYDFRNERDIKEDVKTLLKIKTFKLSHLDLRRTFIEYIINNNLLVNDEFTFQKLKIKFTDIDKMIYNLFM